MKRKAFAKVHEPKRVAPDTLGYMCLFLCSVSNPPQPGWVGVG